jgi:hypothetical protein
MATKMWILVFAGTPSGDPKSAHTSIYLEHEGDSENKGTNFQLVGRHPVFRLEHRESYNPSSKGNLRGKVPVRHLPTSASRSEVSSLFADTRVKNSLEDADWNCRNWVGDVLQNMVGRKWLTMGERDKALDKMIDLCLDIEDEDDDEPMAW